VAGGGAGGDCAPAIRAAKTSVHSAATAVGARGRADGRDVSRRKDGMKSAIIMGAPEPAPGIS
jgi:hypothetical protein